MTDNNKETQKNMIEELMKQRPDYRKGTAPELQRIRCGIAAIDWLLGGGIPLGRSIEIVAEAGIGKTTSVLNAIKGLLDQGYEVVYLDLERTVTNKRLKALGLEGYENFHYIRPESGTDAISLMFKVVQRGASIVVYDSVPFLASDAAYEAEPGELTIAPQAKLLSDNQYKIAAELDNNDATALFINQTRATVGKTHGPPTDSSGGQALKFMCSTKIKLTSAGTFKTDGDGFWLKLRSGKNKVGPPHSAAITEFRYHSGIDRESSLLELATDLKVAYNRGAHFHISDELVEELGYENSKIGHGKAKTKELLRAHEELYQKLYDKVMETPMD